MLILTRKLNEEIKIGSGITVKIISISENTIKIGIDAPQNIPVSYTHLRAHETVLDLVCRLLLEKKTTKKQKHNNTQ